MKEVEPGGNLWGLKKKPWAVEKLQKQVGLHNGNVWYVKMHNFNAEMKSLLPGLKMHLVSIAKFVASHQFK